LFLKNKSKKKKKKTRVYGLFVPGATSKRKDQVMYKAPDILSKSNLQPPENSTEKEEDGSRGRKESTHTKKKSDGYVQPSPAMVSSMMNGEPLG